MAEGLTFGEIMVSGNAVAETTVDTTLRKITAFANGSNGEYNRTTPDYTSSDITIDEAGTYEVKANLSYSGSGGKTYFFSITKNGTAVGTASERVIGVGGDIGSVSFCARIQLAVNDVLAVGQKSTDGGTVLTAKHICLSATRKK